MYTSFASVYDRLMNDVPYRKWAEFYAQLLRTHGVTAGRIAECACGTGNLTLDLAKRYPGITGIDISPQMLALAAEKARNHGYMIPFVRQDMRALSLPRRADAVLATCDGVNYLTRPEDVRTFFTAARQALRPEGVLLFDVSTPYKLKTELGDCVRALTDPDISYIWQSRFEERTALFDIRMDIFVLNSAGSYDRILEEQTQRAHTQEELKGWLSESGFQDIAFYGDMRMEQPAQNELRWHVAAHPKK